MVERRAGGAFNPLPLGHYPTPVQHLPTLSCPGSEIWAKRDDLTNPTYGGNKVRKLEWLLADVQRRAQTRIVTVGAVGSHHVLATTYFGRRLGLEVEAILVPQPRTAHADEVLRAGLALGLQAYSVRSWAAVVPALVWRVSCGARYLPLGGSSAVGAQGYVNAARELASQVRRGELPEPDVCVVALGSGGTAAGLAAGFEIEGLRTRVVGVCVSEPAWALRAASHWLARTCARHLGIRGVRAASARLVADSRFLGAGYGHETADGHAAAALARDVDLMLDPTYTAKAFACALWYVRARRAARILYWHTLSRASVPQASSAGAGDGAGTGTGTETETETGTQAAPLEGSRQGA